MNFKQLFNLSHIKKKTFILLILIILFGLSLKIFFVPHIFQVYDDEYVYNSLAKKFSIHNNYCDTPIGTSILEDECQRSSYPPGHAFLFSLLFSTFGLTINNLFIYSIIISTLSVVLIFFLSFQIFKEENISLWSSLLLIIVPVMLRLSGSAASEVSSFFFLLLTLIFTFKFLETKNKKLFYGIIFFTIFLIQIRIENILFVFLIITLFFIFKDSWQIKNIAKKNYKKYFVLIIIFLLLLLPVLLNIGQRNIVLEKVEEDFTVPKASLSIKDNMGFFKENIQQNIVFWFDNKINPIMISALALCGGFMLFRKERKTFDFLIIFFIVFLSIYTSYNKNLIFSIGREFRFTSNLYLPIILFASFGLNFIWSKFIKKHNQRTFLTFIVIVIIILIPFFFKEFVKDTSFHHFSEFNFLSNIKGNISDECTIFTDRLAPPLSLYNNKVDYADSVFSLKQSDFDSKCNLFYWNSFVPDSDITKEYILNDYDLIILHQKTFSDNSFEISLIKPKI